MLTITPGQDPEIGKTRSDFLEYQNEDGYKINLFIFCKKDFEALRPTDEDHACVHIAMKKNIPLEMVTAEEIAQRVEEVKQRRECMYALAEQKGVGNRLWEVEKEEIDAEMMRRQNAQSQQDNQTIASDLDINKKDITATPSLGRSLRSLFKFLR